MVYDPVSDDDEHTVRGEYYPLFSYYGHNIVVARLIEPNRIKYPSQLPQKLSTALQIHYKCTVLFSSICFRKEVATTPTVEATWNNLRANGINPIMLHFMRKGIGGGVATRPESLYPHIITRGVDEGLVTLLASEF